MGAQLDFWKTELLNEMLQSRAAHLAASVNQQQSAVVVPGIPYSSIQASATLSCSGKENHTLLLEIKPPNEEASPQQERHGRRDTAAPGPGANCCATGGTFGEGGCTARHLFPWRNQACSGVN